MYCSECAGISTCVSRSCVLRSSFCRDRRASSSRRRTASKAIDSRRVRSTTSFASCVRNRSVLAARSVCISDAKDLAQVSRSAKSAFVRVKSDRKPASWSRYNSDASFRACRSSAISSSCIEIILASARAWCARSSARPQPCSRSILSTVHLAMASDNSLSNSVTLLRCKAHPSTKVDFKFLSAYIESRCAICDAGGRFGVRGECCEISTWTS